MISIKKSQKNCQGRAWQQKSGFDSNHPAPSDISKLGINKEL
jgi:hypothetical protein